MHWGFRDVRIKILSRVMWSLIYTSERLKVTYLFEIGQEMDNILEQTLLHCCCCCYFDALAKASDVRIERMQVVFICWMQDSKLGSLRHQIAIRLSADFVTNITAYRAYVGFFLPLGLLSCRLHKISKKVWYICLKQLCCKIGQIYIGAYVWIWHEILGT